jgi:Na+/melibiose symporter-like transporter
MKLDYKKTLKVGTAFAIVMVFWSAYDYVVPLLLENAFGLSNMWRGLIMGLDNFLSLFMLPLFGKLSDKTVTKFGKRTPFIVLGTLITVVLMVFVPVSANKQLKEASVLRAEIVAVAEGRQDIYLEKDGTAYDAEGLYRMLFNKGYENADYCDHDYLDRNGLDTWEDYSRIALNPYTNADGTPSVDKNGQPTYSAQYKNFVKSGLNTYASAQVNEKLTMEQPATLVIYMVILFLVLMSMATFRSPAVALMPDVTPKPLRSPANAMINLAGGVGGALAFIIYTVVLLINPTGYIMIFALVAASMLGLLAAFLLLVKETKLVAECKALCDEYGISNDEEEPKASTDGAVLSKAETAKHKKAKLVSFFLILSSIFMWFMGYNAISSNLSIYITKTLNLSAGLGGIISGVSMAISAIAFIPVGYLAVKIGRRKSIILGFALAVVAFALIFFFAANPGAAVMYLFTIFYLVAGFGLIIANVNTFPMVVELSSTDTVGKYTGLYYTATMSAQAITPFIAGIVMDKLGNKFLFLYSSLCVIIAIALMFFVRHGDSKAIPPKSKLELLGGED